jgi:hypothetical protein
LQNAIAKATFARNSIQPPGKGNLYFYLGLKVMSILLECTVGPSEERLDVIRPRNGNIAPHHFSPIRDVEPLTLFAAPTTPSYRVIDVQNRLHPIKTTGS